MKVNEPLILNVEDDKVVNKSPRKPIEVVQETVKAGLSPATIRRNLSADNFLKFQWPWTV